MQGPDSKRSGPRRPPSPARREAIHFLTCHWALIVGIPPLSLSLSFSINQGEAFFGFFELACSGQILKKSNGLFLAAIRVRWCDACFPRGQTRAAASTMVNPTSFWSVRFDHDQAMDSPGMMQSDSILLVAATAAATPPAPPAAITPHRPDLAL